MALPAAHAIAALRPSTHSAYDSRPSGASCSRSPLRRVDADHAGLVVYRHPTELTTANVAVVLQTLLSMGL